MRNYFTIIGAASRCSGVSKKRFYYQLGLISCIALLEAIFVFLLIPFLELFNNTDNIKLPEHSKPTRFLHDLLTYFGWELTINVVAIFLILAACLREMCSGLNQYTAQRLVGNVERGIQNTIVSTTLESTFLSTINLGSGKFLELCNVCSLESAKVVQNVLQTYTVLITLLSYFAALLFASPIVALIACVTALTSSVVLSYTVARARVAGENVVTGRESLSQVFFELHDKFREIKVNSQSSFVAERVKRSTWFVFTHALRAASVGIVFRSALTICLFALSIQLILTLRELEFLDISILAAGLAMMMRLLPLVLGFTRLRQSFAGKYPYLNKIVGYLGKRRLNKERQSGAKIFTGLERNLQFKSLEFRYPNAKLNTLHSIDLNIEKGQSVAIVGASGSGKSTLVDMIPRLIVPDRGALLLDDTPISNYTIDSIRKKIAYLSQSPALYDGTIRENVTFFETCADDDKVKELISNVGLADFVEQLPHGLNTVVGNAGMKVSGGQAQRLAIARALFKQADIFIFDEPTSALDAKNARRFVTLINDLCKKMKATVIVISHNWDTVSKFEQMVKLENGRIAYLGKPDKKIMVSEIAIANN